MAFISSSICAMQNLSIFIDFGISDDIVVMVLIIDKKLLHFKPSQLGQILCVNTSSSQARHKYRFITLQSYFLSTDILMVRYVCSH